LLQQGFIMRTPRGRVVTHKAYSHFGLQPPSQQPGTEDIFDS
jgi:holliday junction DNA helicase RuvB